MKTQLLIIQIFKSNSSLFLHATAGALLLFFFLTLFFYFIFNLIFGLQKGKKKDKKEAASAVVGRSIYVLQLEQNSAVRVLLLASWALSPSFNIWAQSMLLIYSLLMKQKLKLVLQEINLLNLNIIKFKNHLLQFIYLFN